MPGQFRSAAWDPGLIVAQMVAMQCLFYVSLGTWITVTCFMVGSHRSLDQVLGYKVFQFTESHGRLLMGAFVLNSLTSAAGLWYTVKRTKQCLDFTLTAHLFHFVLCCAYNLAFPNTLSWWLMNIVCIVIMTVLGEFLCMRSEMKAIPLALGPKVDL